MRHGSSSNSFLMNARTLELYVWMRRCVYSCVVYGIVNWVACGASSRRKDVVEVKVRTSKRFARPMWLAGCFSPDSHATAHQRRFWLSTLRHCRDRDDSDIINALLRSHCRAVVTATDEWIVTTPITCPGHQ